MSQREEAQRRQPRLASLAKNSECPSPNRSAWRDGAVVDCGADFASRRVCAPVVVDRKPFTRPDHGGVCAWPPLHDVLGGFVDRHDCAAVLVMAGDDAADGEAHGVSPSVMVWGGSFAGRRCDCNGLTSRRIPAASYALSVPRPLGSCIVHHSKMAAYVSVGSNSVIAVMSAARPLFLRKRTSICDLAMSHWSAPLMVDSFRRRF